MPSFDTLPTHAEICLTFEDPRTAAAARKAIGKQLAEARKRIPAEERKRIAKAAVAKREEYKRESQQQG